MNELISQEKLVYIFQKWIKPFIPENKDKWFFGMADGKFYWNIDGKPITTQRCTDDNGTTYWRIYQNVNFDKPCLEIFPDHIRLQDESGYFEAFSVDSIRDLSRMIEIFENKGVICPDPAWVVKEENTMFNAEEINAVIKELTDEIKKLKEHNAVEVKKEIDRSIEQAKKSTDTVCCDTPNATNGFTPGKVSELIKSMRDNSRILVPTVKEIMINKPATIVFWSDGSKTTSVCDDADKFDPEVGISICIAKKYLGGTENLQLEARRALTRYERREAKKLKKNKKTDTNKSNKTSKKKK